MQRALLKRAQRAADAITIVGPRRRHDAPRSSEFILEPAGDAELTHDAVECRGRAWRAPDLIVPPRRVPEQLRERIGFEVATSWSISGFKDTNAAHGGEFA